jgi:hypothetical protein
MTAQEIFDELAAPFPKDFIEWRVGSTNADKTKGLALAYIDARAVMDQLDRVCGPANWQCKYSHANGKTVCDLGILLETHNGFEWVWKADGAGDTDFEAEKGALSDAFKRAGARWGIGRYLYDLPSKWVEIEQRGKTSVIKKEELGKLEHAYEDFCQQCGWGIRAGVYVYRVLRGVIAEYVTSQTDVADFREKNAGMIAQLPVAMRRHLDDTLDRIGAQTAEAAE